MPPCINLLPHLQQLKFANDITMIVIILTTVCNMCSMYTTDISREIWLHETAYQCLRDMGKLLRYGREAIYGAQGAPEL